MTKKRAPRLDLSGPQARAEMDAIERTLARERPPADDREAGLRLVAGAALLAQNVFEACGDPDAASYLASFAVALRPLGVTEEEFRRAVEDNMAARAAAERAG